MSHFDIDGFTLPFSGSEPLSKQTSYLGANDASERVGRQCLALLTCYREHGPLTDRQAAALMGVERSTVNARRGELVKRGLVASAGRQADGGAGVPNTLWGLVKG